MEIAARAGSIVGRLAYPVSPGAFRFFLALLVFIHHLSSLDWGTAAVYCFFMLSGFWIETMWSAKYRHARQPYLTYLISRIGRLTPTMVLVSLITLALLPPKILPGATIFADNPFHLAVSTVLLLGYAWLPYPLVGSAWSLDIEMQFYVLAPLLVLGLGAAFRPKLSRGAKLALMACILVCALIAPVIIQANILPRYIWFFIAGMTASNQRWHPSQKTARFSMMLTVLLVIGVILSPWRGILVGGAHPGPLHIYAPAFNVALAIAMFPFAIATTRRPSDELDRMMGDLSYIVYLQHWLAMQWFFVTTGTFLHRLVVALTGFALVLPGSWLIWQFYDKPANRIRARWIATRMPVGVPVRFVEQSIATGS